MLSQPTQSTLFCAGKLMQEALHKGVTLHPMDKTNMPIQQNIKLMVGIIFLTLINTASAVTFNVTNNGDSGAGSLRDAVNQANVAPGADDITFDAGLGQITLTSG